MRYWLALLLILFSGVAAQAAAEDIYIAESAGSPETGNSCAQAHGQSWYNSAANWSASTGKINGGDTVHLCGTIVTQLSAQASGTMGNIITIVWETGAKLYKPTGTLMSIFGKSYFLINCASQDNAFQTWDNGTLASGYSNQAATSQLKADGGAHDFEVKNCDFDGAYVHTTRTDHNAGADSTYAIKADGSGSNVLIHNNTFNNCTYCVYVLSQANGALGLRIYHNTFTNYNQGIRGLGSIGASSAGDVEIYNNDFGGTSVWDTDLLCGMSGACYHHNAIHVYGPDGWTVHDVKIYNNYVHGDWGDAATSMLLYGECAPINKDACTNFTLFDNVVISGGTTVISNFLAGGGGPGWAWYNNTFIGNVTNDICYATRRADQIFINNVAVNCTTFVQGAAANTFLASSLAHNAYGNQIAGSSPMFQYGGVNKTTFALWQSATSQDATPYSQQVADLDLDALGQPTSGSTEIIAQGQNLTSLGITALNSDINGVARSASAAWDIGAYVNNVDPDPPVPGNSGTLTSSNVYARSLTLNWTKATDAVSPQAALVYYPCADATATVTTVADCIANALSVGLTNVATYATGVVGVAGTTYHTNVAVTDELGNFALYTSLDVTLAAAPTVSVTSPTAGAVVSGAAVAIAATAASTLGIASVTFKVDGVTISTDSASPFTASWNSTLAADGAHLLTAVATDSGDGQTTTSSSVSVTVSNGAAGVSGAPIIHFH